MKYVDAEQPDHRADDEVRRRTQRWMQLALMPMRDLRKAYAQTQREHGLTTMSGGPVSREEIANAIMMIENSEHEEI